MLSRLFRSSSASKEAAIPAGSRVYAVGDIHGRADLLAELQQLIAADRVGAEGGRCVLVYLGDYVDRGHESRDVIDRLLDAPMPGMETVYLLGNHERTMLEFLTDLSVGPAWLTFGGVETLLSYGISLDRSLASDYERLAKAQIRLGERLPQRHRAFLEQLTLQHVEGDYLFVHAGIRPGVPLARQRRDDLLWIREPFLSSGADHGKVVVHGHSISPQPEVFTNRIGIDTGAFMTGRLTCLVLEGTEHRFLQTGE